MIPRQERQLRKRMPRLTAHMDANGWEVIGPTGSGHIRLVHTSGRKATAPTSASKAAERNTIAWLRRIERGEESRYDVG